MEGIKFIHEHLNKMKRIQMKLLDLIEDESDNSANLSNFLEYLKDQKIREDKFQFKEILHLLSRISNNHHRNAAFFDNFEKILLEYSDDIKNYFSNFEIFDIFRKNKRILLFLFEEKILIPENSIFLYISNDKYKNRGYLQYFYPEFKTFYSEKLIKELNFTESDENFEQNRKKGENDKYLYQLIQNDSIEDFIVYITKRNIAINIQIEQSIYETNLFLLKNDPNLIEYAAFYGSIQIFQYLQLNGAKLEPTLWLYAIHSQNPQLIHMVEENLIKPKDETFCECFREALKCHHINILKYIKNNLLQTKDNKEIFCFSDYLHFYNFVLLIDQIKFEESEIIFHLCHFLYRNSDDKKNCNILFDICKYDYLCILDFLLNNTNVNTRIKYMVLFFYVFNIISNVIFLFTKFHIFCIFNEIINYLFFNEITLIFIFLLRFESVFVNSIEKLIFFK